MPQLPALWSSGEPMPIFEMSNVRKKSPHDPARWRRGCFNLYCSCESRVSNQYIVSCYSLKYPCSFAYCCRRSSYRKPFDICSSANRCGLVNLVTESFVNQHRVEKRPSESSIVGVSTAKVQLNHVESRYNGTQICVDAEVICSLPIVLNLVLCNTPSYSNPVSL